MNDRILHFESDYTAGAHPRVLDRLASTNLEHTPGYGDDAYCQSAVRRIRAACACPEAEVRFLVGGTQTNATVLDALLRPYEGVLAATCGHIAVHEAGAVEAAGHKVIILPGREGKVWPADLADWLDAFYADATWPHMVQPGALYLSHPTELGTLYSLGELEALSALCHRRGLRLYVDGARLGYGLAAPGADVGLPDLARLCDAFSIGGTKVGALMGEAVVFPRPAMAQGFFTLVKRHGALLAKGRLLGLQFDTLFTDGLYTEIGRYAVGLALRLKSAFVARGYRLHVDSPTNQQFVELPAATFAALQPCAGFEVWSPVADGAVVARFVTSWATREADVDALIEFL